jgi:hypothetical protein
MSLYPKNLYRITTAFCLIFLLHLLIQTRRNPNVKNSPIIIGIVTIIILLPVHAHYNEQFMKDVFNPK